MEKSIADLNASYDGAQKAWNASNERMAGFEASINELSGQLQENCVLNREEESEKKKRFTEKKQQDDALSKALHARMANNEKVLNGIRDKAEDLDGLEKRYTWLKTLSNTANGNLPGKER